jgi:hypothetical protein
MRLSALGSWAYFISWPKPSTVPPETNKITTPATFQRDGRLRNVAQTTFYKGESQEKNFPGDWKEHRFVSGSPAHVMLGGSWGFLFPQIHVVVVTTSVVSDATSSTVAKIANHGSI